MHNSSAVIYLEVRRCYTAYDECHASWEEWLLFELRHRYLALCGLPVQLHEVHSSINDLDACYDPGRTYMWARLGSPQKRSLSSMCESEWMAFLTKGLSGVQQ